MKHDCDVLVVGAGPVGLLLGSCLQRLGLSVVILEQRSEPLGRTRAIGVLPPAIELCQRLGLAQELIGAGVRIRRGAVYAGARRLGELDFERGPTAFGFVLSLPQRTTERILCAALPAAALQRGCEVVDLREEHDGLLVRTQGEQGERSWRARWLAGCDGARSSIRSALGSSFEGGDYPDAFAMGEFADRTGWGDEARIFFDARGFVESFPLPGGVRRWVLHAPGPGSFAEQIEERTGAHPGEALEAPAPFVAQHALASVFARGRIALAGDAAHLMSPIGGQGMNVGWADAWDLAHSFAAARDLSGYAVRARRRASIAIRRASQNLAIGRGLGAPRLRTALVSAALRLRPAQPWLVRRFTLAGV